MRMLLMAAAALCVSGCATTGSMNPFTMLSTADDETMYRHAASTIGVSRDQMTISNQTRVGDRTSFTVTTAAGAEYRCTVSVAFTTVNDITCPPSGN